MLYTDSEGVHIVLEIGDISVSQFNTAYIAYEKPSGIRGEWEATIESEEKQIRYITQKGDLDEVGLWKFQAHLIGTDINTEFWGEATWVYVNSHV